MKLLLYGGTFDPPHNGHLNNLRAAASRVHPDCVVVMPAGVPPHKHASATPGALRLEMCQCFRALAKGPDAVAPRLEVSGWEIAQAEQGRRNYTVLTLEMLARRIPHAELYLAIGSDMLLSFDAWFRWQDILHLARLVVVSRSIGDDVQLHEKAKRLDPAGARILFAPVQALPMASSQLRARLTAGDECETELPAQVRGVIRREALYRDGRIETDDERERGKGSCAQPDG
ncbi:MAG: nicotinate (nicotinamide) nucleotide adenylyltransferase [Faecalibacterium sp.]